MPNINYHIKTFAAGITALLFAFLIITGCKPKPGPAPATQYSTLLLHLHTNIDTNEAVASKPYKNADGRMISLGIAQLYISNIRAVKADGSIISIKDTVILKTIDNEEFSAGKIPAGNYKTIMFDVGVDSPANHTNPAIYHSGQALAPQVPSMWFGNTGEGYIFLNISGMLDSSSAKNGTANYPFFYEVGSDALLKTITMPEKAFSALPDAVHIVHITVDYGKLFNGINVKTQNKTSTFENPYLAGTIAGNIPSMFSYEE